MYTIQADGAHEAHRDAEPAGAGRRLDGAVCGHGVRVEPAEGGRVVGGGRVRRGRRGRGRAGTAAVAPAAQRRPPALPHAARALDAARVRPRQHLPHGHAVARHLDTIRRLDDDR